MSDDRPDLLDVVRDQQVEISRLRERLALAEPDVETKQAPPWAKEAAHIVCPEGWLRGDYRWAATGHDDSRWHVSDWLAVGVENDDLDMSWTVSDIQDVARAMTLLRRAVRLLRLLEQS